MLPETEEETYTRPKRSNYARFSLEWNQSRTLIKCLRRKGYSTQARTPVYFNDKYLIDLKSNNFR